MSRRRTIAAVGAAVVAAMAVWLFAGGGNGGDAPVQAGVVRVVRVASSIPRGTAAEAALADGSLEVVEVAASDPVVPSAVAPEALAGTVAVASVAGGGFLVPGVFALPSGPGAALTGRLPSPGHTALAVTVDATRAVGGWVQPGDRVNLLVPGVCADEVAVQAEAAAVGGEARCRRARYLYQAVDVLAVGPALDPGGDPTAAGIPGGPVTVVLSLPPRAAQWVATWENELTLAIVPADYLPRVVDPLPPVVERLPGETEGTLQPGCADPTAPDPDGQLATCSGEPTP